MPGTRDQGVSWEPSADPTQRPRPRHAPDKSRLFEGQSMSEVAGRTAEPVLGPSAGWEPCLGMLALGGQVLGLVLGRSMYEADSGWSWVRPAAECRINTKMAIGLSLC